MLKKILLAEDPLDPSSWENFEVESICEFLAERFEVFPDTARIYHNDVCEANDVTPSDEQTIEDLEALEGEFAVIIYAGDPATIAYVIVALVVAVAAAVVLGKTNPPLDATRTTDNSSPNNELSGRSNRERINGRIPDIFGTVRSVPDLISPVYTVWQSNRPSEHSLMCIGVGAYDVDVDEVRDGVSLVDDISGATVEVYAPDTKPTIANTPQLTVGTPITDPLLSAVKHEGVNGQRPLAPNENVLNPSEISFIYTNNDGVSEYGVKIYDAPFDLRGAFGPGQSFEITGSSHTRYDYSTFSYLATSEIGLAVRKAGFDGERYYFTFYSTTDYRELTSINSFGNDTSFFGKYDVYDSWSNVQQYRFYVRDPGLINPLWLDLEVGEEVPISVSGGDPNFLQVPASTSTVDLDGVYEIDEVGEDYILLKTPSTVNSDWSNVTTSYDFPFSGVEVEVIGGGLLGPFILDDDGLSTVMLTVLSQQGLYLDDGTTQTAIDVGLEMYLTPIDGGGVATGTEETIIMTVKGSKSSKSSYRNTFFATPSVLGRQSVTIKRTTNRDFTSAGQVNDEVQIEELLSGADISNVEFGNVSIVRAKTIGSSQEQGAGQGKLNMLVTRKIPRRISGNTFTTELYATNRADEILSFICLDPRIGNRSNDEIDFDSIYDTVAEIETYFGTDIATEFNYTFDSDNLSFEETVESIATAIFCTAYRRGMQIKLNFEKETDISTLIFNHRNKLPGSETRAVRFGNQNEYDGVQFEYVDPSDDSIATFYLPDEFAVNPKKIEMPGIRSKLQAHFHANRAFNKIKYQHIISEFEATQEADLLVLNDRILVADNTRPNIQDGEILDQTGLELTLSQNVDLTVFASYTIFIQYSDELVESIAITAGTESNKVVLATAPRISLSLDADNYARTTYLIVGKTEVVTSPFLVTEKTPQSNFTSTISAVNYDSRYYTSDSDYENGIVGEDGNTI